MYRITTILSTNQSEAIGEITHESHRVTLDRIFILPHKETLKLIFPRLYWHGFRASLNGKSLEVGKDESGFLTSVTMPQGAGGVLEFSYFPVTWRYLWICPLLALICAILFSLFIKRHRPDAFWRPAENP